MKMTKFDSFLTNRTCQIFWWRGRGLGREGEYIFSLKDNRSLHQVLLFAEIFLIFLSKQKKIISKTRALKISMEIQHRKECQPRIFRCNNAQNCTYIFRIGYCKIYFTLNFDCRKLHDYSFVQKLTFIATVSYINTIV